MLLKAGCLCAGRADGSCLPMCAISPLGMAKPQTLLACSSPSSSVVAQPLPGHHLLLMHHESPGASPRRSPPPPGRPATSLSERYSLRIPKKREDSSEKRRRSWDEAAGRAAVPGKSVTLSRQASSQTAARRRVGGGGEGGRVEIGQGGGGGSRGREKSEGGERELSVSRKSITLSGQEIKSRKESNSQHVSLPSIANKPQQVPRNTKKIFAKNMSPNAKIQPQVKGAKTVNGQDFNRRSNRLKQDHHASTVESNSNVSTEQASRLQPRSSSLREPKPSSRGLARNQSLQSRELKPGQVLARNHSFQSIPPKPRSGQSSLELHSRSNLSVSKLTSSETGSMIPTGWRS